LSKSKKRIDANDALASSLKKLLEPQQIEASSIEMIFPGTFEDSRTGEEQIILWDFIRSAATIYACIAGSRQLVFSAPAVGCKGALVVNCKTADSATALKNLVSDLKSQG
jgi:hypothetical protein